MVAPDTLLYRIALTLLPGVGVVTARKILQVLGDAKPLFEEKKGLLTKIPGLSPKIISEISGNYLLQAEKELEFILSKGIRAHFITDESYPRRLKDIEDAPVLLYTQGDLDLNAKRTIGIVGTRKATRYGQELTQKLVKDLNSYSPSIISGLALGIDVYSHQAALDNGLPTIGIPGHGLDRMYPIAHQNIATEMIGSGGGLLTEFPSGTRPDKENFPKRNRIIAGMSDAVVVVEAGEKGGALITAKIAFSYHKDVFAFPGRVNDPYSIGCNRLIKQKIACSVESAEDIAWEMGWTDEPAFLKKDIQTDLFQNLSSEEKKIVESLQTKRLQSIDDLSFESSIPLPRVSSILLNLEFEGLIKSMPGKMYQLAL